MASSDLMTGQSEGGDKNRERKVWNSNLGKVPGCTEKEQRSEEIEGKGR